jgi:hypothetical protein
MRLRHPLKQCGSHNFAQPQTRLGSAVARHLMKQQPTPVILATATASDAVVVWDETLGLGFLWVSE